VELEYIFVEQFGILGTLKLFREEREYIFVERLGILGTLDLFRERS
jgi:hypothetical protein